MKEESHRDHILIKHRVDLGLDSIVASVDNLLSLLVKDDIHFVYNYRELSLTNNYVYYY